MSSKPLSGNIPIRFTARSVEIADHLTTQGRGASRSDLLRDAADLGMLLRLSLIPPDPATGLHGTWTGKQLARELRPFAASLLDFLSQHGELPGTLAIPQRIGAVQQQTTESQALREERLNYTAATNGGATDTRIVGEQSDQERDDLKDNA